MRKALRRAVAVSGVAGMLAGAAILGAEDAPSPSVERLGFLTGYWKGTVAGAKSYEEQWMPPAGGSMVGCSRMVNMRDESALELATITMQDGKILFQPYLDGKKMATFTLKTVEGNSAVFVAPENDFPKSIEYRHEKGESRDRLIARVTDGNEPPSREFVVTMEAATP